VSFTDGDFDAGDIGVTVGGPCSIVAPASLTNSGTWIASASGDWVNATVGNAFARWRVTDDGGGSIVATRTGNVYCVNLHIGFADSIKGAYVTFVLPTTSNFLEDSGGTSVGGVTDIFITGTLTSTAATYPISIEDSVYIHATANTDTMVIIEDFTSSGLVIDTVCFMDSTNVVTSVGDIVIGDGADLTSTGLWLMTGTGNLKNAISGNIFNALVIAGTGSIVATRTGVVYAESLIVGTDDSLLGAYTLLVKPDVDYFFANGGVIKGGYTILQLAGINGTLNGFTIEESLKVIGASSADSLIPLSAITAAGVEISSVAWDDGGFNVTSEGSIVVHDTGGTLHSTAVWTQTAAGTVVNRQPANAFSKYVVTATCLDTIFYNPSSTNDSFTVADTFDVTGSRGYTFLYGDPTGTLMFLPSTSTATDCDIENLHVKNHVLRAVGCMARGHMSGVICQQ